MKERIISLISAAAMIISAAGCNSAPDTADTTTTTSAPVSEGPADYEPTAENVKLLGRAFYDDFDGELICAYSGTGCEFTATAKSVTITVKGDTAARTNNNDNAARFAVYVDGERTEDIMLDETTKIVNVFSGDTEKTATVSLVKLSETANSTLSVDSITVDGSIAPTAEKDLYIEFVGDSITCGYGVDDEDRNHHFSTSTEDCTKAYGYKTAEKLGADYSLVSISGYGIISGYTNNPDKKSASQLMPLHYEKVGFSYSRDLGSFKWDFARQPDAVVINLGTNDESYCKTDKDKQAEFTAEYVNFLKTVRARNPEAKILCVLGVMGSGLYSCVEEAVNTYSAETGDTSVYAMKLPNQDQADGIAADWHPTEKTHEKTAEIVAEKLKEILG
ncbi:MAG: GDSL family lipase [Ruminiclostridium sp.]|nr:GDSL family lipase [Ruminiclostridium sp.]